jgi:hypothetical protein
MPSRRRARTKNLGTNLADVQRRMRYLERRPVRTKLQRKIVTAVNIAPETITADEVNFGTAIITTETNTGNVVVDNPKDGLLVVSSTNGSSSVYSGSDDAFIPITDTAAQATADTALEESTAAAAAAVAAEAEAAAAASASAAAEAAAQASFDEAAASALAAQASFDEAAASAASALEAELAAQASFDEAAASAEAANLAEAAAQASFDEAAASAEAANLAEAAAQASFDEAAAAALAATAAGGAATDSAEAANLAELAAQAAFEEATAAATAANDAEAAALASSDGAADALAQAQEAAAQAQEAADQAIASAQAAADADAAAVLAAEESAAAAEASAAAELAAETAALEAADSVLVAESAVDEATAAKNSALAATESANKKNSVFRAPASAYAPATAPTANSIGDIWFDTTPLTNDNGAGGAKPQRWNGTAWEPFGLSYAAITSLDADTITAGTLTGRTVRTSASGNRIELADTDVLKFWKDDTTLVGTIQPGLGNEGLYITAGSGGSIIAMSGSGWADDSAITISTSQGSGNITMFDDTYNGEAGGGMFITGNSLVIQGTNGWDIKDAGSDAVIYGQGGDISMQGGGTSINLTGGEIYLGGTLVLGAGTYVSGTGAPTSAATEGTIIFKYV